jgi:hypothetical protein
LIYSFGSPRVRNDAFCAEFDAMVKSGAISKAYRIVNGQDVVACTPHMANALVLGNIGFDHCGHTVLITEYADCDNKNDNIRSLLTYSTYLTFPRHIIVTTFQLIPVGFLFY